MNFKPGDKVWVDNPGGGVYAAGTYAGVLIGSISGYPAVYKSTGPFQGWWYVDIDGIPQEGGRYPQAHEDKMRRRYDPPDWVKLCKLDEVRPSVSKELV